MPRLDMTLQELKERALFVRRDICLLYTSDAADE